MNIIKFLQDGGQVSPADIIKGIQNLLGVDDTQMELLVSRFAKGGVTDCGCGKKLKCGGKTKKASCGTKMDKCGGSVQKGQEGMTILPVVDQTPASPEDIKLTRKQARQLSSVNKDYNRRQFRTAYQNAKHALGEYGPKMSGKERRNAARVVVAGTTKPVLSLNVQEDIPEIIQPVVTGPTHYTEGVTSTGPVSVVRVQPMVPTKKVVVEKPVEQSSSIRDSLAAQRAKTNAWNQYQYERGLYDYMNNTYRPNQGSAAYQHWMWKDFNDAWDSDNSRVKRDFIMRTPTQEELLQFNNAGAFTHGTIGWAPQNPSKIDDAAKQRLVSMGINPEHFMFYTQDDSRYRANAGAKGIAPTSDLYNGTARVMGAVLAPAWGAAASQAAYGTANTVSNAIDDFARAGYSRAAATPVGMSGMDITTYPGQASRTMHLNMQTPVTVNEAVVNHTFVPTAFPYGYQEGGTIVETPDTGTIIEDTTLPVGRKIKSFIDNTQPLRLVKRGLRNLSNSALGLLMPNVNSESGAIAAAAPMVKKLTPAAIERAKRLKDFNYRVAKHNYSTARDRKMADEFADLYNRTTGHEGALWDVLIEKCGGSITKHQNTSTIGTDIPKGVTVISPDKTITITNYDTEKADTTGTFSNDYINGEFHFGPNGRTATVWNNFQAMPIHNYADKNWIMRHRRRQWLPKYLGGSKELPKDSQYFDNLVNLVNSKIKQ